MTKPQDEITLIRADADSLAAIIARCAADEMRRYPTPEMIGDDYWCGTCEHLVVPDDGCCSCGKVLDWRAFEEADKRLAEQNADPDAALYAAADFYHDWMRA